MNPIEDQVRAATRAEASTMREVRPLRLPPEAAPRSAARSRFAARRPRRWQGWLAPVTAAAVVIALAISLVTIRDSSNGRVVPATSPVTAAGGLPNYYVTLSSRTGAQAIGKKNFAPNDLVVGDARTGRQLTTLTPPKGSTFFGVTAAADDDRTFVVDTLPLGSTLNPMAGRTWYLLRLAPGRSAPARLTRLAVPQMTNVTAIALSQSGAELAVATGGGVGALVGYLIGDTMFPPRLPGVLRLYSVSTGNLLRTWSTSDESVFGSGPGLYSENNTELTWVDDDHAIAFASQWVTPEPTRKPTKNIDHQDVRVLDVASRGSDLLADSRVIWSQTQPQSPSSPDRPDGCTFWEGVFVAADGKAVVCPSVTDPTGRYHPGQHWTVRWLTYATTAPTVPRVLYTVTIPVPLAGSFALNEQPLSASSAAIMAVWYFFAGNHPATGVHVAVVSAGKLRPLPVRLDIGNPLNGFPAIAW
jgi:hypothetical protein